MKTILRLTLIVLLAVWAAPAPAYLETITEVKELEVDQTSLPRGANGRVVVRECIGCELKIWSVNSATTYHIGINGAPVSLTQLRSAIASGDHELIYAFIDTKTDVVTKLALSVSR